MASVHRFLCPLVNGMHARPASHLAEFVRRIAAAVEFTNERTGRTANARSVLALVGTDTRFKDPCRVEVSGGDEAAIMPLLAAFLTGKFAACDEPLPAAPPAAVGEVALPRSLRAAGLTHWCVGKPACRGVALARAVAIGGLELPRAVLERPARTAPEEQAQIDRALSELAADYGRVLARASGTEAAILEAHLAIVNDPAVAEGLKEEIASGRSAAQALVAVAERHRQVLSQSTSAYVRERVFDLEDIVGRLWEKLNGTRIMNVPVLQEPSVVCAEHLTPTQFLALDRRRVSGLVLKHGGQTSHVIILARSFGIPTLTGVEEAVKIGRRGEVVALDANLGIVVPAPADGVLAFYRRELAKIAQIAAVADARAQQNAVTADGVRIEVAANIATDEEASPAFAKGAEGIGLFRTELLFASRAAAPSEDEQYEAYATVIRAAAGRPVIIRTLDVGGDKPLDYLPQPAEPNPFLGRRGVRLYADHLLLIKTQLRAIVRAAAHGPVKVMVPMIATYEEARQVREWLTEVQASVASPKAPQLSLGFMIEVPAAGFIMDALATVGDFFSIGTNDLAQYFAAADRENAAVASLNHPLQPAFWRLLRQIVDGARRNGRWIGLCGELAENASALPLLVGLGLDELSLAAPRVAATKEAIARLNCADCVALLDRVLACRTRAEIEATLAAGASHTLPLIGPDLVLDDVDASSKENVVRAMVDALQISGRISDANAVEAAIWAREDTYSTGFGDGFALPHCKTDALAANSIVVARLRRGVEWGALDGQPVNVAILLGIRASDHDRAHMQVLARLSRLVTRDEFRASVRDAADPARVVALINEATRG